MQRVHRATVINYWIKNKHNELSGYFNTEDFQKTISISAKVGNISEREADKIREHLEKFVHDTNYYIILKEKLELENGSN